MAPVAKTKLTQGSGAEASELLVRPRYPKFPRSSRSAPHPGTFLESRFLQPLHISQAKLAAELGVSRRRINELIVGKRAITPDTAIRLGRFFDTDPEFWMLLQMRWDLFQALEKEREANLNSDVLTHPVKTA